MISFFIKRVSLNISGYVLTLQVLCLLRSLLLMVSVSVNAIPLPQLQYNQNGYLILSLPGKARLSDDVAFKQIKRKKAEILWISAANGSTVNFKIITGLTRLKAKLAPDAGRLYIRWRNNGVTEVLDSHLFIPKKGVAIVSSQILIGGYVPDNQKPPPPLPPSTIDKIPIPSRYDGTATIQMNYFGANNSLLGSKSDQHNVHVAFENPKYFEFKDHTKVYENNQFSLALITEPLPTGTTSEGGLFYIDSFAKAQYPVDRYPIYTSAAYFQYWNLSMNGVQVSGTLADRPSTITDFDRATNIVSSVGGGFLDVWVMLNRLILKGATLSGSLSGDTLNLIIQGNLLCAGPSSELIERVDFSISVSANKAQ